MENTTNLVKPLILDETGKAIVEALTQKDMTQQRIKEIEAATDKQLARIPEVTELSADVDTLSESIAEMSNDLDKIKTSAFHWVEYNTLNIDMSTKYNGTTYPNIYMYFSQLGAITKKGKIKIHHYADGKTNKALLLRKTTNGFLIEKFFSWTETTTGYEEIETPFVCDGSGTQYVAIQGVFYRGSTENIFNQWYNDSTDEYITIQASEDGKAILQYYISVYEPTSLAYDNPLRGKRWAVLGDSRSIKEYYYTTKHYFEYISDNVGGMLIENCAVSGAKVINNIFLQPNKIKDAPHIITCYCGVNDYGQIPPTPLGTIEDATSGNTFYAKMKELCTRMLTFFPNAHIALITPQGQKDFGKGTENDWSSRNEKNTLGLSIRDYANAIIDVAGYYGIPVYDNCNHGGYTTKIDIMKNTYFIDGLHENAVGNKRLADGLINFLKNVVN